MRKFEHVNRIFKLTIPPKFLIIRILGNALPPRHDIGNTLETTRFILQHEPRFPSSKRLWITNRIVEAEEKAALRALLQSHGEEIHDIPFNAASHFNAFLDLSGVPDGLRTGSSEEFSMDGNSVRIEAWLIRHKSQHLIGINQARNYALSIGRAQADWTLVLDGGTMFDSDGWTEFTNGVKDGKDKTVALIDLIRTDHWTPDKIKPSFINDHGENFKREEPQMAFHKKSTDLFDERLRYGDRNKSELICRLGVAGPWQSWVGPRWEIFHPLDAPSFGNYFWAGHIRRLPTQAAGKDIESGRWLRRFRGVSKLSFEMDFIFSQESCRRKTVVAAGFNVFKDQNVQNILPISNELFTESDRFITDKLKIAPNSNAQYYYTLAPFVSSDGQRSDGKLQHGIGKDFTDWGRYDAFSFKQTLSRICGLAYCGEYLKNRKYLEKSADLLKKWFISPSSRMEPSLRFAQVRPDKPQYNEVGLIEFRQIVELPAAISILHKNNLLSTEDITEIKRWLFSFKQDCVQSKVLSNALRYNNNIGTWAMAIFAAIDLFLGNDRTAFAAVWYAPVRLIKQLLPLSIQQNEIKRMQPLHYCLFNLSAWWSFNCTANQLGFNLLDYKGVKGESLQQAMMFCHSNRDFFQDYGTNSKEYDIRIEIMLSLFGIKPNTKNSILVTKPEWGLPSFC